MKIKWHLSTGMVGSNRHGGFEMDDNSTDDEIEELVQEDAFSHVDWWWEVEDGDN